jgi:hypothetical protein
MIFQLKNLGIGAWLMFFDGMLIYSIGANEIGLGQGMLHTRFGFTNSKATAVALLTYLGAAIS